MLSRSSYAPASVGGPPVRSVRRSSSHYQESSACTSGGRALSPSTTTRSSAMTGLRQIWSLWAGHSRTSTSWLLGFRKSTVTPQIRLRQHSQDSSSREDFPLSLPHL